MMSPDVSLQNVRSATPVQPAMILCVDDEPNILSSLRRLFRAHGYQTLIAEGGAAALKILETETVDLVISDMRMPEMDGARFLECVRTRWPDTIRLLLTGYSDIQSILDAINRGEIYRYITKPWDDNDILLTVQLALERQALEREKQRLEVLTHNQNEELKVLNASLEFKVQERTIELKNALDSLVSTNEKLRTSFLTSIKVFSSLIEMRGGALAGHSRRVADVARRIAVEMGMDERETQEIFVAGLLHNIGKIGFSDELLAMPVSLMKGENLGSYRKYPARGEQLLISLENLRGAASVIRSHQERFDGSGFPDGLSGLNIPCGARILALASDYENLQRGVLVQRSLRPDEAKTMILQNPGNRYDPMVVAAFKKMMGGSADDPPPESATRAHRAVASLSPENLRPGMVVARDLFAPDGSLLLSANHTLSARLILQMQEYQVAMRVQLTVCVDVEQRTL
ncbi:MAG: HD domain-containing phosphohydrolase [Burkholderiaceae bacterium]